MHKSILHGSVVKELRPQQKVLCVERPRECWDLIQVGFREELDRVAGEIDALGGAMARATDTAGIQFRTLNASKGPAVRATRAQADRVLYRNAIRQILEQQPDLQLFQQAVDDLVADVSIIGKDVYDSTVKALDEHEVVLDPDQLRELGIRVAQNVGNFNTMLDTMGSAMDLLKDVGPIANEVIIDTTKKLHEFEHRGSE